jgi:hypothetical protein
MDMIDNYFWKRERERASATILTNSVKYIECINQGTHITYRM